MALRLPRFQLAAIVIIHFLIQILICEEYDILWHDSMDDKETWTGYNSYEIASDEEHCPNFPDVCARVSYNNNGRSYIRRSTDITGYDTFQLQIDVSPYPIRETNYCQIWYQYNDGGWIKYGAYDSTYTNLKINLPPASSTSTVLGIQLEITYSTSSETSCYWDNIILRGMQSSSGSNSSTTSVAESKTVLIIIWLLIVFLCIGICVGTVYIAWKRGYNTDDIRRLFQKQEKQKRSKNSKKKSKKNSKRLPKRIEDISNSDGNEEFDRSLLVSWLENEVKLSQYVKLFLKNGYDNLRTVKMIENKSQLQDLGIKKLGHQMLIMEAIRRLDLGIYDDVMVDVNNGSAATDNIKVFVDEDENGLAEMSSSSSPSIIMQPDTEAGLGEDKALKAIAECYERKAREEQPPKRASPKLAQVQKAKEVALKASNLYMERYKMNMKDDYDQKWDEEKKYQSRPDRQESDSMIYNEWSPTAADTGGGGTDFGGLTPFGGGLTFFDAMHAVTIVGNEVDEDHFFGTPRFPSVHRKLTRKKIMEKNNPAVSPNTKRARIEKELIDTEKTYLEGLRVLMYEFIEPIFAQKMIDAKYKKQLACNLPQLITFHEQFLEELMARPVSKVFNEQSAYFKMYIQYISEYENICDIFARFRKNKKLKHYLDKKTDANKPLSNYLILPIQRTPRYMLLLSDLKKNTSPMEEAYKEIERALKEVQAVCNEINEKKREIENMSQCLRISETLKGLENNIVEPHRQFIDHFLFQRKKDGRNRQFFLFNDIVIIANPKWETKSVVKLTKFFVKRPNVKSKEIFINIVDDEHLGKKDKYKGTAAYVALSAQDIPKKHQHPNVSNLQMFCDAIDKYRNQTAVLFKKDDDDIKDLLRVHEDEEELIHWQSSAKKKGNKSKVLAMLGTPGGM